MTGNSCFFPYGAHKCRALVSADHIIVVQAHNRFFRSNEIVEPSLPEPKVFQKEIRNAVKSALGCGGPVKHERLVLTRVELHTFT